MVDELNTLNELSDDVSEKLATEFSDEEIGKRRGVDEALEEMRPNSKAIGMSAALNEDSDLDLDENDG